MLNPPIEPEHLRVVAIHDLAGARQPFVEVRGRRPVRRVRVALIGRLGQRVAIQAAVAIVLHIGREAAAAVEKEPVLGAMVRYAEDQPLGAHGIGQLADQVALRPHLHRTPLGELAIVHRKAIVVFGHRHDITRARCLEQPGPRGRIVVLGRQLRDEILVAELGMRAIGVRRDARTRACPAGTYCAGTTHCRSPARVHAPVDENAELRVLVPRRHLELRERVPLGLERAACGYRPDFSDLPRNAGIGSGQRGGSEGEGEEQGDTSPREALQRYRQPWGVRGDGSPLNKERRPLDLHARAPLGEQRATGGRQRASWAWQEREELHRGSPRGGF